MPLLPRWALRVPSNVNFNETRCNNYNKPKFDAVIFNLIEYFINSRHQTFACPRMLSVNVSSTDKKKYSLVAIGEAMSAQGQVN